MDGCLTSSASPYLAARKPSPICESPPERSPLLNLSSDLPSNEQHWRWTATNKPMVEANEFFRFKEHSRRMPHLPDGAETVACCQLRKSASAAEPTIQTGTPDPQAMRPFCASPAPASHWHGPGVSEHLMLPVYDLPPVGKVPLVACKSIDPGFLRSTTYPAGKHRPSSYQYASSNASEWEVQTASIVERLRNAEGARSNPCGEVWLSKKEWLREAASVSHRSQSMYQARHPTDAVAFDFPVAPPKMPDLFRTMSEARTAQAGGAPSFHNAPESV